MALARNAGPVLIADRDSELLEIERWYADMLANTPAPVDLRWDPVKIGPTWQHDDDGWVLPEYTLGWQFLAWCGYWLVGKGRNPWKFTPEQARFILWFYAINPETTDFLFHSAILQRLKGWGKDPMAAAMAAGSLHAPVNFDHWDGDRPVGVDEPDAWTQIVAVSLDQTKNTMKLFPSLIGPDAQKFYGIQIGKRNVWSDGDRRQIEAVTASPAAIEGGRPKLIVRNETQNWDQSNGGHDMAGAIEGNAAKAEAGHPARILDICNAYQPGRDSVAERAREAYEATQVEDGIEEFGVMLDSLEAPPDAPLTAEAAPEVVQSIAGDSTWLDTRADGRIVSSIMDPANPPSESRRKWYNQITGSEDAWVQPQWVDAAVRKDMALEKGDRIALFGDGSKSRDDTALIACRLNDGFCQTLFFFHPTDGAIVDRDAVDMAVDKAFEDYKVVAFWFDPSHAKDNHATGDDDRFWWPLVDKWHKKYNRRIEKRFWAVQAGANQHAIAFDMLKPTPQQLFQAAVSQVAEDLKSGECLIHDGARLKQQMKYARRREGRYGMSVGKEHRSSTRKVDLAVCLIGARMLMRFVNLKKPIPQKKPRGVALA